MASPTRILTRKEEGIFSYQLLSGKECFAVRMEYLGKDWRKFGFATITQARKWRDSRKGRAMEGRLFPEQEKTQEEAEQSAIPLFSVYARQWLEHCRTRGLKYSTWLRYRGLLDKHLKPHLGHLRLDQIRRGHVREFVTTIARDSIRAKTVHNALGVLSAIFTHAMEDEHVEHNPARNPARLIKRPKRPEVAVFSHTEEQEILKKAKESYAAYYPFILFLFRTGCREGEAVALRANDLDFRGRYALIARNFTAGRLAETPKGGRSRKVDLARDVVATLKEHLTIREAEAVLHGGDKSDWLFPSPEGDVIRSNNFRDRVWRPLLNAVGLSYRNVHAIRHTFATRMIMHGVNIVYVQKQLGHCTIQLTVDTYTHWIEEADRGRTIEVDRLAYAPSKDEVGTLPGTPARALT